MFRKKGARLIFCIFLLFQSYRFVGFFSLQMFNMLNLISFYVYFNLCKRKRPFLICYWYKRVQIDWNELKIVVRKSSCVLCVWVHWNIWHKCIANRKKMNNHLQTNANFNRLLESKIKAKYGGCQAPWFYYVKNTVSAQTQENCISKLNPN